MDTISQSIRSVNLSFQGGLVQVKVKSVHRGRGGRRGSVNDFSAAARRRLLKLFATLLVSEGAVFVTLTYPSDFPSPKLAKKHLRSFLERIRRRCPRASAIWRLEFQKRGAPHFHLVMFGVPFIPKEEIQSMWGEIIDYKQVFTRIEAIKSNRKLMGYVSKYVAKRDACGSGFNHLAYLHGQEFVHPTTGELSGSIGRWWGVFNRDDLPFASLIEMDISGSLEPFYKFRRYARRAFAGCSKRPEQGFFLLVGDAGQWFDCFSHVLSNL